MTHIFTFVDQYSGTFTILLTIAAGIWSLFKFREYLKDKKFKTYHELIDEMVNETRNEDRVIKLDRQIAIVFELRNFSSYYPVTKRILTDLKKTWTDERIIKEIDLTLEFISRTWFGRVWQRFRNKK